MRRILLIAGIVGLALVSTPVLALATPASGGITVSPAIEQIVFDPGQTAATFPAKITNNTGENITVAVSAKDFVASGQNGGIRFLGLSDNDSHSLVSALIFGQPQVAIAAGQAVTIPITVSNTSSLATGGHYAAIVYRVIERGIAGGNTVNATPAVSTLVFVSTTGGGTQQVRLAAPTIGTVQATLPTSLNLVFGNTGNTQTTLRGLVQVYGIDNQLVSQGIINIDSGLILPGSERLFSVNLGTQAQGLRWPGFYYVRVAYRHDGQTDYTVYQRRFLYISVPFVIGCIALIIVLGIALRRLILRRIYPLRNHR